MKEFMYKVKRCQNCPYVIRYKLESFGMHSATKMLCADVYKKEIFDYLYVCGNYFDEMVDHKDICNGSEPAPLTAESISKRVVDGGTIPKWCHRLDKE